MAGVWSAGGNTLTAKFSHTGFGSQTAAVNVCGYDGTSYLSTTEEYNGSA